MSIELVSWALRQDLDDPVKVTLIALANRARAKEGCWPKIKQLAADTGKSERTLKRHLAVLEELGLISKRRLQYTCVYQFNVGAEVTSEVPSGVTSDDPPEVPPVVTSRSATSCHHIKETKRNTLLADARREDARKKRKRPIPADFEMPPAFLKIMRAKGYTDEEAANEFELFKDHHAARGNEFIDHVAAARTWAWRAQAQFRARPAALGTGRHGPVSIVEACARGAARAAARRLSREQDHGSEDPLPF